MEQIVTAMSCCGEDIREVLIPAFLKEIGVHAQQREVINYIGDFLAAVALINGDFTIMEAECWTKTVDESSESCLQTEAGDFEPVFNPEMEKVEETCGTDKEDETETVSNNISNLNDKIDSIINAINMADRGADNMEHATVSTLDDKTLEDSCGKEVLAIKYALLVALEKRDSLLYISSPALREEYMQKIGVYEEQVLKAELEVTLAEKWRTNKGS